MLQHVATAWKTWSCCCTWYRHFGPSTLFQHLFLTSIVQEHRVSIHCAIENSKKENIRPVLLESLQITGKKKAYMHNSRTCFRQHNPTDTCVSYFLQQYVLWKVGKSHSKRPFPPPPLKERYGEYLKIKHLNNCHINYFSIKLQRGCPGEELSYFIGSYG